MRFVYLTFVSLLLFSACNRKEPNPPQLVSVQFVDRNGFSETISNKERLDRYKNADFLSPQPYTKVVRLFERDKEGKISSAVTSYHENGELWQYLEVVNGRAHGAYKEWYANGNLKIQSYVMEGRGDISQECMESWVFDKESLIYDENGNSLARFFYDKGMLSGKATYYHPNGKVKKITTYEQDLPHGEEIFFNEEGTRVGKFYYVNGIAEGKWIYEGDTHKPKFTEEYKRGALTSGVYYDLKGRVISNVINGNGLQTIYDNKRLVAQYAIKDGKREGKVYLYFPEGTSLQSEYTTKDGNKHGEEWVYYENIKEKRPKVYMEWYEGKLQGRVKTWYPSGELESERELYNNKKNGPASAWYKNGSLMFIEEYENDQLVKGLYMKKGEKNPVSTIENGEGIATLYDPDGYFLKKILYHKGNPIEE